MLGRPNGEFFETALDEQRHTMMNRGGEQRRNRRRDLRVLLTAMLAGYGEVATTGAALVYELTSLISKRDVYKLLGMPAEADSEQAEYAEHLLTDAATALREGRTGVAALLFPDTPPQVLPRR